MDHPSGARRRERAPPPASKAGRSREQPRASGREILASATDRPAPMAPMVAPADFVPPMYRQNTDTEKYQHLEDNPIRLAAEQPVSTFSIDVDTGAYANVAPFPERRKSSAAGRRACRGDAQLLRLSVRGSRGTASTPFRVSTELAAAAVEAGRLAPAHRHQGVSKCAAKDRPPANLRVPRSICRARCDRPKTAAAEERVPPADGPAYRAATVFPWSCMREAQAPCLSRRRAIRSTGSAEALNRLKPVALTDQRSGGHRTGVSGWRMRRSSRMGSIASCSRPMATSTWAP